MPSPDWDHEGEPFAILCFGDTNTWGLDHATGRRLGASLRWPRILQAALGHRFLVVEDGLPGRTTVFDDPLFEGRRGLGHLRTALHAHQPLDLVILQLGTDDLPARLNASPETIAAGVAKLGRTVLSSEPWPGAGSPQLLIVGPPRLDPKRCEWPATDRTTARSHRLPDRLKIVAEQLGSTYVDVSELGCHTGRNGAHLDGKGHALLATHLARHVSELLASE